MSLTWPFERLDPKSGLVPPYFDYLINIDLRARAILHARSSEEIAVAAQIVILMLDGYYEGSDMCPSSTAPVNIVQSLQKKSPYVRRHGSAYSLVEQVYEDNLDYWCLLTEFNYLKEHIDSFVFDEPGFKNPRQEELFCAYAFLQIQLCMEELEPLKLLSLTDEDRLPEKITRENIVNRFTRAGELALMAMEAVCYAERILEVGGLNAGLGQADRDDNIEIKIDSEVLKRIAHRDLSSKGGKARAAGYALTRKQAIEYYEKNRKHHKSDAETIRQMIADLRWHRIPLSTLEGYIREHKRGKQNLAKK